MRRSRAVRASRGRRNTMRAKSESLSVGFHCEERHETFGGIAANIAFHLARQGIDASPSGGASVEAKIDTFGGPGFWFSSC